VVQDLPEVGRNLFDQLNVPVYVNLRERVSITLVKLQTVPEVFNYFAFGTGKYDNAPKRNVVTMLIKNIPCDRRCNLAVISFFFIACQRMVGH